MPEMKGITVKIPADLHAEVKAYLETHGMTMGEFIAQAVDNELHPKLEIKEEQPMERLRTLAFQVPDSLFQRVKAYLERNHMSQKQFVIGLIESELEQDEVQYQASHPEEQEDEEESDDQAEDEKAEEENQDEFALQEAPDGLSTELEEQPAAQEDAAPMGDFEASSEEVAQEDDGAEESWEETEENAEEFTEVEDTEDSELEDVQADSLEDKESQKNEEVREDSIDHEDAQDEEEQEDYSHSMSM